MDPEIIETQLRLSGQIKDRFLEIKRAKGLTDDEVLRLVINDFFEKKLAKGGSSEKYSRLTT